MRKIGRNEKCYCGSGLKYKKCCINKTKSSINIPQNPSIINEDLVKKVTDVVYSKFNSKFKKNKPNLSNIIKVKPLSELERGLKKGVQFILDTLPIYSGECHLTSWMVCNIIPNVKSVKGWCGIKHESFEECLNNRDIKSYKKIDERWIKGFGYDNQEFWYDMKDNFYYIVHSWNGIDGTHFDVQYHCDDKFFMEVQKQKKEEYKSKERVYIPIEFISTNEIYDKEEEFGLPLIKTENGDGLLKYSFENYIQELLEENMERVPQIYILNKYQFDGEGVGFHHQFQNRVRI
jgi:hypothetical protein